MILLHLLGVVLHDGAAPVVRDVYPPNPNTWALFTLLGYEPRRSIGTVAIVAKEDEHGITPSLSAQQLGIIRAAHERARVRVR